VADASGAAINGVAITISGSEARSSQTNGNGEYAVASLAPVGPIQSLLRKRITLHSGQSNIQ